MGKGTMMKNKSHHSLLSNNMNPSSIKGIESFGLLSPSETTKEQSRPRMSLKNSILLLIPNIRFAYKAANTTHLLQSPKLRRNRTVSIDGEIATRTNRVYLESSLKHRAHQSDHGDPTSPPLQPLSSVQPTLVEAPEGRAQKGDLQTLGASFG
ncbi:WD domain [Striga asiatica]|uniref:WD domain n=1 Tax=Striga asiatica TaxID=4170 RepID=A0A5A7QX20_STRAF|nr:WD domain [Striga asiatica]